MTEIDFKRFEREVEGTPAIIWPETPTNRQEMRLYKPPFQEVMKAVADDTELVIHVIEPKEREMSGSAECLEMIHHQVARAIGVRVHVLFEADDGSARYGGILPDGTPVSFVWNGNDLE
jgi:hypothetical protein